MAFEVLEEIAEIKTNRQGNFIDVNIVEITNNTGRNGRIVVDIRQTFLNDEDQKQSTQKGVILSQPQAEEVYEALGKALEKLDEYEEEEPEEKPKRTAKKSASSSNGGSRTTKKAAPRKRVTRR